MNGFSQRNPNKTGKVKIITVIAAATIFIVAVACTAFVFLRDNVPSQGNFEANAAVFYIKDDSLYFGYSEAVSDKVQTGVTAAALSEDGDTLLFTKKVLLSNGSVGSLNLYSCEVGIRRGRVYSKPKLVSKDVGESFGISNDGKLCWFIKPEGGTVGRLFLYNLKKGIQTEIASLVFDCVITPGGESMVYTCASATSGKSLFRLDISDTKSKPVKIDDNVSEIHTFNFDGFEMFYLKPESTGGTVSLFRLDGNLKAKCISSHVQTVCFDEYVGENLYFYRPAKTDINKDSVFNDDMAVSDATMTEPDIEDYKTYVGIIFKYEITDTSAYNEAVKKYEAKQKRDLIRSAFSNALAQTDTVNPVECFVYSNGSTQKISAAMSASGALATAPRGTARLLYRRVGENTDWVTVKMSDIAQLASDYTEEEMAEYASSLVSQATAVQGVSLSSASSGTYNELMLDVDAETEGYLYSFDESSTKFLIMKPETAEDEYKLYVSEIEEYGVTDSVLVSSSVISCCTLGDDILVLDRSNSGTVRLRLFSGGRSRVLLENADRLVKLENGNVIVGIYDESTIGNGTVAEVYLAFKSENGTQLQKLANNVIDSSVTQTDNGWLAFIGYSENGSTGELCMSDSSGNCYTVAKGVEKILFSAQF